MSASSYERAGVRGQGEALSAVERWLAPTFAFPAGATVLTRFGHYAAVVEVAPDLGIAICTDGVGSKTLIASALDRYDTIGFDCVAMNVNDLICVGARPIALVDYVGVHTLDTRRTAAILEGLAAAAEVAGIAIPGGEMAQLPEVIGSDGVVDGDDRAFDLVGTAVGLVAPDRMNLGASVRPGDAIVGLASSGIHSNGLTLARRILLKETGLTLDARLPELGRSLGDELLEPTTIYVEAVRSLWELGLDTRGLVHLTGDGAANLCRLEAPVGYHIERWLDPPAIFGVIREAGDVPFEEMYRVFNMGVGFVVIVPADQAEAAIRAVERCGIAAGRLGVVNDESGVVRLDHVGLVGSLERGDSVFAAG